MILSAPVGWKQHFGANVSLLEAPAGAGRIRVHERVPLEPLSGVIARALRGEVDQWIVDDTSSAVTAEGEYAAFSRITTRTRSGSQVRFVAAVFGDDFAVILDTKVMRETATSLLESVTRDLMLKVSLGLGVRRRRFVYEPPRGWEPVPNGLLTSWYPPGFPAERATLVVFPAEPTVIDPHQELGHLLAAERERGASIVDDIQHGSIEASGGLVGPHWSFVLRGADRTIVHRDLVCFGRAPYRYALKLESATGTHREVLLEVAQSVAAIPAAGQQRIGMPHTRAAGLAVDHWAE